MSRFEEEVKRIPWPAFAIGLCVWLALFLLMSNVALPNDPHASQWPRAAQLAIAILPGIPLFVLVALVGYVYADARRRGMRYVMWTFLAALIPNAIGIILYFVLRDPLPSTCQKCGAQVGPQFAFCPHCGAALSMACPQCRRAVKPEWRNCAYCGVALPSAR